MARRWKSHWRTLGGLAAVAISLDLLVVLHPTLGYAQGGILHGADLRWDIVQITGWLFGTFAAASSGAFALLGSRWSLWLTRAAAYGSGTALAAISIVVIDRFY